MFTGCNSLESVVFSSGSTGVSNGMFASCNNLTSITLPSSLTSIGNYGFSQCNSLVEIDLTYIKSIGSNAFADCSNISTFIISDQCTSIGTSAFANCSSVSMIRFDGNYPTIGTNAFSGLASDAIMYFNPEKTGWTNYGTINGVSTIALVYISGTFTQQQTLTVNTKLLEAGVVPNGTVFSYQWYEDSSPISGETNNTLVLKYDQVDKTIHVVVSYNIGGGVTSITSISSSAVDAFNNSHIGTVSISGSNTPSSILTATNTIADVDGLGTFYYQWYRNTTSSNVGGTAITDESNSTYTLTGIDVNTYIYVKLYYTDTYGTPEIVYSSPTIQIVGLPPSDVSATATSATTASISFTPSDNVTSYTVTSSPGGITSSGTSSPIIVSGLTANTEYTFTMTSAYGSYTTPSSEASNSIKTYIAAPTTMVATATSATTATVTFSAPEGGSANTISYDLSGGGSYDLSENTFTVTGLTANTAYTFTVNASSSANTTNASALAIQTYIAAPTNVVATATSATTATVTFSAPAGGSANTITYDLSGGGSYDLSGTTFTVTGLTANTAYTFKVIATTATNSTNASATAIQTYITDSPEGYSSTGLEYSESDSTVVTGFTGTQAKLYIPEGVSSIDSSAFSNNNTITHIIINASVTSIGNTACLNCTSLLQVTIQGTGLSTIGNVVFYGCTSLTTINIPISVTSMGYNIFEMCSSLSSVSVGAGNTSFKTIGSALLSYDGTILYSYYDYSSTSYTIPSSVLTIQEEAFNRNTIIQSVSMSNVVTIGNSVFQFCSNLSSITLSNTLTSIGNRAIQSVSITSLTIPSSVTYLGEYAISVCSNLSTITFEGNKPTMESTAIYDIKSGAIIYYYSVKTGWSGTRFIRGYSVVAI
jgi:hypothetical protein